VIVGIAWAVAAALGLVVAAFCGYEIRWKLARLRADLAGLEQTVTALRAVQEQLAATAGRVSGLTGPR
jgi:hypothetical protein